MSEIHVTSMLIAAEGRGAPQDAQAEAATPGFAALFAARLGVTRPLAAANDGAESIAETRGEPAQDSPQEPAAQPAGLPAAAQPAEAAAQLFATLGLPVAPPPASAGRDPSTQEHADAGRIEVAAQPARSTRARPAPQSMEASAQSSTAASTDRPEQKAGPQQDLRAATLSGAERIAANAAQIPAPAAEGQLAAAGAQPAAALPAAAATRAVATIPGEMGTAQWREALGSSVVLFATQRVQSAELRVQPPELGPIRMHIRIEANEASISLAAQHADTRLALESALPRLRELLESAGLAVGHASVGDSGAFGREPGQHAQSGHARQGLAHEGGTPAAAAPRAATHSLHLVDLFA